MSFADWAADTGQRLREEPPRKALRESVRDFAAGARSRLAVLEMTLNHGVVDCPLHPEARFHARTRQDIRRAKTLAGEAPVWRSIQPHVDGRTVFWDVGAYNGHYSVLAALEGADVVAIEPNATNQAGVTRNARLNSVDVDLRPVGLSDEQQTVELRGPSRSELEVAPSEDGVVQKVVPGDDIGPWPDVVKMDIEGHEVRALEGMRGALDGVTAIAVEVHYSEDEQTVRELLEAAGLEVHQPVTTRSETHLVGWRQ